MPSRKQDCVELDVEENTAADRLELSAEQVERLNHLTPTGGTPQRDEHGGHGPLTTPRGERTVWRGDSAMWSDRSVCAPRMQLAKLVAVRSLGKREAERRLALLKG